jgi:hypothetical protein
MSKPCERIAELLPVMVDDPQVIGSEDRVHVDRCLRCQAELARYRRIRRTMASMRAEPIPVDPSVLAGVLEGLDSATERREHQRTVGRRAASFMGLAAATAAGVGGVLVLATRRRSA